MALVFVRLKLAVQRHALGRGGTAQRAWFVLVWVLALAAGIAGGFLVAGAEGAREPLTDAAVLLIFSAVFLAWIMLPLFVPDSGDNSVDPQTLAQYPLTAAEQVRGLLLAGLVGPGALFAFLLAGGGSFAADESWATRIWVLIGAVLFAALCVAASRSVLALLAGFLGSSRGKAVVIAASTVLFLGLWLASQALTQVGEALREFDPASAEGVLSIFPPGAIGRSMLLARDGEWGQALLFLVYGIGCLLLFLLLWLVALRRQVSGKSGGSGSGRASQRGPVDSALFPTPLRWLPRSATTAALAGQARTYFFRSPRAVQGVVIGLVIGAVLGHSFVDDADALGVAAGFVVLMVSVQMSVNALGHDGTGFGYFVAAGAPMREVLTGKLLLLPLVALPVTLVFCLVEGALLGTFRTVLPALLTALGVMLVALAVGAITSVLAPSNLAEPGVGNTKKGRSIGLTIGSTLVLMVVTLAAGFLPAVWEDEALLYWGSYLFLVLLAGALAWLGLRWAGRHLQATQLEVLDVLGG